MRSKLQKPSTTCPIWRESLKEMISFQTATIRDEIEIEVWKHKFKTWRETNWTSLSI
jgi:hypothetical protein